MLEDESLVDPDDDAAECSGQEEEVDEQPPPSLPRKQSYSAPQSPACTPPKCDSQQLMQPINAKCAKFKRQVSFPDDEFIVTGYLEPPIPWAKCHEMCTDDIIESYKKSCEKHGVKPIETLITQIQKVDDFERRYHELNLSGNALDPQQCEALEEVFKRIQFHNLVLRSCELTDEASMALFDMIEFYEVATNLDISHNPHVETRGWHACSRMLKKTPYLESLDATSTKLSEQCMSILCRALRLGSNLSILRLQQCEIAGRTFAILVAALKMNTSLSELYLGGNGIKPSDAYQLSSLLRSNTRLKVLDLNSNMLHDSGIIHGVEGLGDQPKVPGEGLRYFNLSNNNFGSSCMEAVSKALCKTTSLESLDLSGNDITDDGILQLKEGLMKNRSLKNLNLQTCKISCEGAVAIAEYVADSTYIESIDLTGNEMIKFGGLMAISLSMKVNTSVVRLKFDLPSGVKDGNGHEDEENNDRFRQICDDISNFCIRNEQSSKESIRFNNNCIPRSNEDGDIVNHCDNNSLNEQTSSASIGTEKDASNEAPATAPGLTNGRFQVSKVTSNANIPRYVSGKVNGRFKVCKVANSVAEETAADVKSGGGPSINSKGEELVPKSEDSEKVDGVDGSLPESPNNQKRRVTIDACTVPTVQKVVQDIKSRRKSTPSLGTNLSGMQRDNTPIRPSLRLTLSKRLECLDLRSTVPLSPGRVVESCGLPMSSVDAMMQIDETVKVAIPTGKQYKIEDLEMIT